MMYIFLILLRLSLFIFLLHRTCVYFHIYTYLNYWCHRFSTLLSNFYNWAIGNHLPGNVKMSGFPWDPIKLLALFLVIKYGTQYFFEPIPFTIDDYLKIREDTGVERGIRLYVNKDGVPFIYERPDNPHYPYDKDKLVAEIRELCYDIQCIKTYKEISQDMYWNTWRGWWVLHRSDESRYFVEYLEEICERAPDLTIDKLLEVKRELYRFWRGL